MTRSALIVARRIVIAIIVSTAVSAHAAWSQVCRPLPIDSATYQHWVDSLSAPMSGEEIGVRAVGVPSAMGCWTAIALSWEAPLGGALALLRPDGTLASLDEYAGIARLQPAGANRFAFSYLVGHGSAWGGGTQSVHFVVMCSFGGWHWATCLDMPEAEDENTAPERAGPDSSVGLYTTTLGDFKIVGDSVLVHRRLEWSIIFRDGTIGPSRTLDLGEAVIRLP